MARSKISRPMIPYDQPLRHIKNTPPCRRGRRCVKIIGEISNEVNITDTTGLQTAPTGGLPATGGIVSPVLLLLLSLKKSSQPEYQREQPFAVYIDKPEAQPEHHAYSHDDNSSQPHQSWRYRAYDMAHLLTPQFNLILFVHCFIVFMSQCSPFLCPAHILTVLTA